MNADRVDSMAIMPALAAAFQRLTLAPLIAVTAAAAVFAVLLREAVSYITGDLVLVTTCPAGTTATASTTQGAIPRAVRRSRQAFRASPSRRTAIGGAVRG